MVSSIDRVFFLFPMVVGGWMLFALVACAVFSYTDWNFGKTLVLMIVAIFFVTPLVAWFVFRGCQIVCSVRRFSLRAGIKAA
jgi:acyl-CoA hydrolase